VGQGTIRHFFGELTPDHVEAVAHSLQGPAAETHNTTIMFGWVPVDQASPCEGLLDWHGVRVGPGALWGMGSGTE
jgi:hypothetical protein